MAALLAALILASGCPNDAASGQSQYQSTPGQQQPRSNAAPPPPPPQPVQGAGEEGEEAAYTGPKVVVKDFFVDLPYPEYDSPGRYDIKCSVKTEEPVDSSSVWEIIAYGETGEEVGSKQLHIVMYNEDFKPLDLNSFYCSARPASLEFRLTDKTPDKPGEGSEGGTAPRAPGIGGSGGGNGSGGQQPPPTPGIK